MNTLKTQFGMNALIRSFIAIAASCIVLVALGSTAIAGDPYYAMIVRGGPGLAASYDKGILTVKFRKSRNAAGNSMNYGKISISSAAWPDRPLNAKEPFVLKQKVVQATGYEIIEALRSSDRYWKFYCRNTGQGYFDVSRSEKTSQSYSY